MLQSVGAGQGRTGAVLLLQNKAAKVPGVNHAVSKACVQLRALLHWT
jgi:hypothetical protein